MSQCWFSDVLAFHAKFAPERIGTTPAIPGKSRVHLLMDLIEEEFEELDESLALGDVAGSADAMADLIYVVLGCAVTCGVDLRPVWDAVQEANMRKCSDKNEAGKVQKPIGWRPPDIAGILSRQGPLQPEGMEAS